MTATDERADQLAEIAAELACRVRDDDPAANSRWLAAVLPDPADRWALCFVLAAAIPDDRPWMALTAWARQPAARRDFRLSARCTAHNQPAIAEHGDQGLCDRCLNEEKAA